VPNAHNQQTLELLQAHGDQLHPYLCLRYMRGCDLFLLADHGEPMKLTSQQKSIDLMIRLHIGLLCNYNEPLINKIIDEITTHWQLQPRQLKRYQNELSRR
jgi:uncharacterized protein YcsI (UPF0317 family)